MNSAHSYSEGAEVPEDKTEVSFKNFNQHCGHVAEILIKSLVMAGKEVETVSDKDRKELIANFMGLQFVRVGYIGMKGKWGETKWQKENEEWLDKHCNSIGDYAVNIEEDLIFLQKDLTYDTSWDSIMPVWRKFRDLDLDLEGDYGKWVSALQWYLFSSDEPKRFAERIAYAIRWYNNYKLESLKNKPI